MPEHERDQDQQEPIPDPHDDDGDGAHPSFACGFVSHWRLTPLRSRPPGPTGRRVTALVAVPTNSDRRTRFFRTDGLEPRLPLLQVVKR